MWWIIPFFNSNFFTGLVTIVVGLFAFLLYQKQKNDNKQQLAILLVNEIRNAENAIQTVKDWMRTNGTIPDITVLPENNWSRYSYLFSKNLDQDEIQVINKFYSDVERVNYLVTQYNNNFITQINQKADAIQHKAIDILEKAKDITDANILLEEFNKRMYEVKRNIFYNPVLFNDSLNRYLPEINFVLITSAGDKLKQIAKVK